MIKFILKSRAHTLQISQLFSADHNYWFSLKYYIFVFDKVTAKYKPYAVLNS